MKLIPLFCSSLALLASAASVSAEIEGEVHARYSSSTSFKAKMALKAERKAFRKADKDADNTVSYEEFKALLKPLAVALKKFPATGQGDHPEELLDLCDTIFDYFDANADGSIDSDEWVHTRQDFNFILVADLLKSLPALDRNGDGRTRAAEFLSLLKCFVPLPKARDVYQQIVHPYTYRGAIQTVASGTLDLGLSSGQIATVGSFPLSGSATVTFEIAPGNAVSVGVLDVGFSPGVLTLSPGLGISETWRSWDPGSITPWLINFGDPLPESLTLFLPVDSSANAAP